MNKLSISRLYKFSGVCGAVLFVFGFIADSLISDDTYYLVPIHFCLSGGLIALFFLQGGLSLVRSFAIKRSSRWRVASLGYLALFLCMLGLLNYFSVTRELFRWDSTENKVYTLAAQTEQVLSALKSPLTIRAVFPEGAVPRDLKRILERVLKVSDKVTLQILNPSRNPGVLESLNIKSSEVLHLSYEFTGGVRTKLITATDADEQTIVNAIIGLTRGGDKKVYFLQGHGEGDLTDPTEGGFSILSKAIGEENVVVDRLIIDPGKPIPEDADALLIVAPRRDILAGEAAVVEEYLARGGSLLYLHNPGASLSLIGLLAKAGLVLGNDIVIDNMNRMFSQASFGVEPSFTHYGKHPITERFNQGTWFGTVASMTLGNQAPPGAARVVLAESGKESWAERDLARVFSERPRAQLDDVDLKGPVPVAVAFEGQYQSAGFEQSKGKIAKVVAIGDSDFVANINLSRLYNRDFVLNSLNWLLGQPEKVTIRARTLRDSRTGITQTEFRLLFVLGVILLPEILLLCGFGIWFSRRG